MARPRSVIDELAAQIGRLPCEEQVGVIERALTPNLELELLLKRWHGRTRRHDPREMTRVVNRVARRIQRARASARRH